MPANAELQLRMVCRWAAIQLSRLHLDGDAGDAVAMVARELRHAGLGEPLFLDGCKEKEQPGEPHSNPG